MDATPAEQLNGAINKLKNDAIKFGAAFVPVVTKVSDKLGEVADRFSNLSDEEKENTAYHEVGHALITALKKNAEPVQKITIVPRTHGALGYVMQVPEEEKFLKSKEELEEDLVTFMAGRAAEEIVFHSVTTGASNDIEQATRIARAMVAQYGMSEVRTDGTCNGREPVSRRRSKTELW